MRDRLIITPRDIKNMYCTDDGFTVVTLTWYLIPVLLAFVFSVVSLEESRNVEYLKNQYVSDHN